MIRVFFLRHLEEKRQDGPQGYKTIGAYSTVENARKALGRVRDKPGFRSYPERWTIAECLLDQPDDWAEGFDSKTHKRIERS